MPRSLSSRALGALVALLAAAGCNAVLGLGHYDFDHDAGGGGRDASTSSTGGMVSTSSSGGAGGTGGTGSTSTATTSGAGGQDGGAAGGDVLWSMSGAMDNVAVGGAGVDAAGNVYVAGGYQVSSAVPLGGACMPLPTSNGAWFGFLIKLDTSGTCVWAMSFGVMGTTQATALAVSAAGDVTMGGTYDNALTLPGNVALPQPSDTTRDAFVVRYQASALGAGGPTSATWMRRLGDKGPQVITSLSLDDAGSTWVSGWYAQSLVSTGPSPISKMGISQHTGFAIQLDAQGTPGAVRVLSSTDSNDVEALAAAGQGAVMTVTGRSYGGMDFGEGPETPRGSYDGFVARYSAPALSYLGGAWLADSSDQIGRDLSFGPGGELYLAGDFANLIDLRDGITLSANDSGQHVFLARFGATGKAERALSIGDAQSYYPLHVRVLPGGADLVFAGMMSGHAILPGTPAFDVSTSAADVVIGRVDANLSTGVWLRAYGDGSEQGADALAVGPHGEIVIAGHYTGKLFDPNTSSGGISLFVARVAP